MFPNQFARDKNVSKCSEGFVHPMTQTISMTLPIMDFGMIDA